MVATTERQEHRWLQQQSNTDTDGYDNGETEILMAVPMEKQRY